MRLTNLTLKERQKLLNDMNLFGYFKKEEIETFLDESVNKILINNIGKYICDITKNKSKDYNKIVYDYILNIDDIQTIVRYYMNNAIINSKIIIDHCIFIAKNNKIIINKKQILSIILKWYKILYDMGGILEHQCLDVVLNEKSCGFSGYDEQIYNMMLDFVNDNSQ